MFVRDELTDEISAGDILALVNYLPYGTSRDRNTGHGEEGNLGTFYFASEQCRKLSTLCQWIKSRKNVRSINECDRPESLYDLFCQKIHPSTTLLTFINCSEKAKETLLVCLEKNIIVLTPYDAHFPDRLLSIPNAPIFLFVKGNPSLLTNELSIAVVGTREPSDSAIGCTRMVTAALVRNNVIVISGLAIGCDTVAHETTIQHHGKTIAVLAHGLDMVYPTRNIRLASDILNSGGCLISEYFPGVQPTKYQFVERDRIQSGLSSGVIVIETKEIGGTMHTAKHCKEQRKSLACMATFEGIDSYAVSGNQQLLQQGAFPLRTEPDIGIFLEKYVLLKKMW